MNVETCGLCLVENICHFQLWTDIASQLFHKKDIKAFHFWCSSDGKKKVTIKFC